MTTPHQDLAILILAAGQSSRMGAIKQLLPWGTTTLLEHTIIEAEKISKHVFCVLGANSEEIQQQLNYPKNIIGNPHWEKGMGTSIATGMAHLQHIGGFKAVLILLCDQPLLDSSYYKKLIDTYKTGQGAIACTAYGHKNGVPAIFGAALFSELLQLDADFGARKLLESRKGKLIVVHPEGKEKDIDTPESYKKLMMQAGF